MKATRLLVAAAQMQFRPTTAANVTRITRTIQTASEAGVDILLFPECAVTGYFRDFSKITQSEIEDALEAIANAARTARCNILVGCPTYHGRARFNSLIVLDRRGSEIFRYSKIHLTSRDRQWFRPGDRLAFFRLDGVPCTAIICHERRYPELVRLPVMMGAQIVFHSNAGLDSRATSRSKHGGRDGISVRAFENEVYYVFANSVGPQGDQLWSAGDSKIVAPNSDTLALANNREAALIQAHVDLAQAGRKYAREALQQPAFLRTHWKIMMTACQRSLRTTTGKRS